MYSPNCVAQRFGGDGEEECGVRFVQGILNHGGDSRESPCTFVVIYCVVGTLSCNSGYKDEVNAPKGVVRLLDKDGGFPFMGERKG